MTGFDADLDRTPAGDPMRTYLDACASGTLVYQRCDHCGRVQSYPRVACVHCHRAQLRWERSRQEGRIASSTTVYRAASIAFQARTPYQLTLVDVDEGFRLMMDVDGPDRPAIGVRIRIEFHTDTDGSVAMRGVVVA